MRCFIGIGITERSDGRIANAVRINALHGPGKFWVIVSVLSVAAAADARRLTDFFKTPDGFLDACQFPAAIREHVGYVQHGCLSGAGELYRSQRGVTLSVGIEPPYSGDKTALRLHSSAPRPRARRPVRRETNRLEFPRLSGDAAAAVFAPPQIAQDSPRRDDYGVVWHCRRSRYTRPCRLARAPGSCRCVS